MPLNRYLIRNEYNLADPELYKSADKDDPEALLEGVAMAGLVGVLRQLGDLAEFAAEIFHDLHEEVMATAARGHDLIVRVQQLEAEFPPVEKSLLSQTNHTAFLYNPGFDWHSNVHMDENLVTQGDLPRFVMDNYEECRGPPRLFLLDKFDVAGAGACLKRYTDPSYVKVESVDSNTQKPEGQREKRIRKVKRRGTRWKFGDTPEVIPSSHAKLHQLLLEERIETGAHDPERRVKLKKRTLDRFESNEKSRKSYMKKFVDTCLPVHKVVHEISINPAPLSEESNIHGHSGLEIVKYDALKSCDEPLERHELACPPCSFPEVEKYSINDFNEVANSEISEVQDEDHEDDAGKILLMCAREMEEEELAAVDYTRKSKGSTGEYHSDVASETDNFMDALATIDYDIDIDTSSSRMKREISQVDSDGSVEQHEPRNPFLDYQSVGNSSVSDDGSMHNKERNGFPFHDTVSSVAESAQEIDGYFAEKSSELADQPSDRQNTSLVIPDYQKHDDVSGDTSENPEEKLAVKSEMDGRSLTSAKVYRGFAKTELKWMKRSDEVSHRSSLPSSISSAEDELQRLDKLLSVSRTDAVKDDSIPNLFERVNNCSSSVSSHSQQSVGVVDLPMEEISTDAVLMVNRASVTSLNTPEPAQMELKDANVSSHEEESQYISPWMDLAQRSGKADTRISGVGDTSQPSQLDVSNEAVPCSVGEPNICSISAANNGELMDGSRASTHTDMGEIMVFSTCLDTGGPGIARRASVVNHTEIQSLGFSNCSEECLTETEANRTSELDCLEVGEGLSEEAVHPLVSGVFSEGTPEVTDVSVLDKHHTDETTVSNSQNMEEMHQELVVEEAESSLTTGSTDSCSASSTVYLDQQLEPHSQSRGMALLNGGPTEATEKEDPLISVDEYDGHVLMNAGLDFPISPSVLEEEKSFPPDQIASAMEAVVIMIQDNDNKDRSAVAVPLSSTTDQSTSSCIQFQDEESPCFEVPSYLSKETSQALPLIPDTEVEVQNDVSHVGDVSNKLDQSSFSHPQDQAHESPFKDGFYENGRACETLPLKYDRGVQVQDDFSKVEDAYLSSSVHYGMTAVGDNIWSSPGSAPNPFLAVNRQDSFYSADGSDVETVTESVVKSDQVKKPQVHKLMGEYSHDRDDTQPAVAIHSAHPTNLDPQIEHLEAQMVMPPNSLSQNQPLMSTLSVETDGCIMESPPAVSPSISVYPLVSMLPDQIPACQNTETRKLTSPAFPSLGVIPDSNDLKLDEMPPPPPLPPMQWRLGRSQVHASPVAMQSACGLSATILPTGSNHDLRSQDSVGSQNCNPFSSYSSEDSQTKHSEDYPERSVELELIDMVHDHSEQTLLKNDQPLYRQSLAACQDDLQPSDPGLMSHPGRISSEKELFIEDSVGHTNASGGRRVIKENIAVQDEKLQYVSSAIEQKGGIMASSELADASSNEEVIKPETDVQDEKLPVIFPADEKERVVLNEQVEHASVVTEQETVNPPSQIEQEIAAQGEKLELISCVAEQERDIEPSYDHTDSSIAEKVIKLETDLEEEKLEDVFAGGEQEKSILGEQLERVSSVMEQGTVSSSSQLKEVDVQDEPLQLPFSEVVLERSIEASSEQTDTSSRDMVIKLERDAQDAKLPEIPAVGEQGRAILKEQIEQVSLVTEQGTANSSSQFEERAERDEKRQHVSTEVVQERAIEASFENTDAPVEEKMVKLEIDVKDEGLPGISASREQEGVILDVQFEHVSSETEQGTANPSGQSSLGLAVQNEKLKHVPSAGELERATQASSKHTDELNPEEEINLGADVQDHKFYGIPPAGKREIGIHDEQLEYVSSATEQGTVNPSSQSKVSLTAPQGHVPQPGFIAPEDQEAWSTNVFRKVEHGNGNGKMQKKAPRPRNPLIDAVVAVDRSKFRKVGEIAKSHDKSRTKEREQSLPQLRRVGERVKPRDGSKAEESIQNLPRLRKVEERTKPKDIPRSEGKELSLPQLRKVGEKVKSPSEAKSEAREQSLPQLRKVGGRVKHHDKARSEEREQSLPRLRKVGERLKPQDDSKSEEEKKQRLPALRKVGERGETRNESTSEEREQGLPTLPNSGERDSLMEQIRSKTFNLKPTVATRTSIPGPQTNLNVAAILQKANVIRQAMVGSDEEDSDGWE